MDENLSKPLPLCCRLNAGNIEHRLCGRNERHNSPEHELFAELKLVLESLLTLIFSFTR